MALNEYYVEVHAGPMSVGFSKRWFTEYHRSCPAGAKDSAQDRRPETILDFLVTDVDAEYERVKALGVEWVMHPDNAALGEPEHDVPRS